MSVTKSRLNKIEISDMVRLAFGEAASIKKLEELKDGFFNTAYMIELSDGRKTVLKVSPAKEIKVLRYEKNIMNTEVTVMNKLKEDNIQVPKIYYYGKYKTFLEFFFMEFIEGTPLNKLSSEMTEEQLNKVYKQLGEIVYKFHNIEGKYFGYISQPEKRFDTWKEAFLFMVKELLEDAADEEVKLPYSYNDIYNMIYEKSYVLDEVKQSSILHKDLWEGNIFIEEQTNNITGIIDWERAIYGDSIMDLVCGFLLDKPSFIDKYFGNKLLTYEEKIRVILYNIYLFLIMVIECTYRKVPESEFALEMLKKSCKELLSLDSALNQC
ncbi:phosphotransferase [Clostridium sp. 19966]|uniref:phosphotransferase family protein n=1 Tax=Clostridium sp. 19966 TaxID=2768166 RepID=UPI0028E08E1E|nr:phosphotransferase [Clostridium sp. 19966]MDT8719586.1 phosphotransferase [Clostridium sp. 19966]